MEERTKLQTWNNKEMLQTVEILLFQLRSIRNLIKKVRVGIDKVPDIYGTIRRELGRKTGKMLGQETRGRKRAKDAMGLFGTPTRRKGVAAQREKDNSRDGCFPPTFLAAVQWHSNRLTVHLLSCPFRNASFRSNQKPESYDNSAITRR